MEGHKSGSDRGKTQVKGWEGREGEEGTEGREAEVWDGRDGERKLWREGRDFKLLREDRLGQKEEGKAR